MISAPRPKNRARTPAAVSALRRRREALEAVVEAALAALDELDNDADLEPSLTPAATYASEDQVRRAAVWAPALMRDDREAECEGEGEQDDREPDLGSQESDRGGTVWNMTSGRVLDGEEGPGPDIRAAHRRVGVRRYRSQWGAWHLSPQPATPRPASKLLGCVAERGTIANEGSLASLTDPDEAPEPSSARVELGMGSAS